MALRNETDVMNVFQKFSETRAPASVALIRFMVGAVFLSEGIQKFLMPDANGAGRFARIGIPSPEILAPFVAVLEIGCGTLLIVGWLTRLAAMPLLIDISVAILSTKVPILLGKGYWGFSLPKLTTYGFWSMAHEARTDFAMLMGLVFLLCVGAGSASLDAALANHSSADAGAAPGAQAGNSRSKPAE